MKDPSSDIAVLATKGSLLVRREREKQAALKGQKKEWKLEGTQIGKAMGIEEKKEPAAEEGHGMLFRHLILLWRGCVYLDLA